MDRNFNIDDSFSNLSVTTNNVSRVSNNIISSINVIDTTVEQKGSGVSNFSSLPIGGTIKVEGKYPERNYITFNIDLLSNITPYSSNIYVPVSSRITIQTLTNSTPTNNTPPSYNNTTTPPSNQYPPIGRVGNVDGESVALNNIVWIWDEDAQRWFEERFDDRD
jgi:hypothetical protein